MCQDTTLYGEKFIFTPDHAKTILKRLKWADRCDTMLIYYEQELSNKQAIISNLEQSIKEWNDIADNQSKALDNNKKLIAIKDRKILGLNIKLGIGIPIAGIGGFLLGKAISR